MASTVSNECIESQIFVAIRHGHRDPAPGVDVDLTEKGREEAKIAGPALAQFVHAMLGKQKIELTASTLKRAQQTATLMAENPESRVSVIHTDDRVREKINNRKKGPEHFEESDEVIIQRMKAGIEAAITKLKNKDSIAAIVVHANAEKIFRKSIGEQDPDFLHHLKTCEAVVYKKAGDQFTILGIVRPDFAPFS